MFFVVFLKSKHSSSILEISLTKTTTLINENQLNFKIILVFFNIFEFYCGI